MEPIPTRREPSSSLSEHSTNIPGSTCNSGPDTLADCTQAAAAAVGKPLVPLPPDRNRRFDRLADIAEPVAAEVRVHWAACYRKVYSVRVAPEAAGNFDPLELAGPALAPAH